jgi:GNAT superfamily N-acetyltransferase
MELEFRQQRGRRAATVFTAHARGRKLASLTFLPLSGTREGHLGEAQSHTKGLAGARALSELMSHAVRWARGQGFEALNTYARPYMAEFMRRKGFAYEEGREPEAVARWRTAVRTSGLRVTDLRTLQGLHRELVPMRKVLVEKKGEKTGE